MENQTIKAKCHECHKDRYMKCYEMKAKWVDGDCKAYVKLICPDSSCKGAYSVPVELISKENGVFVVKVLMGDQYPKK